MKEHPSFTRAGCAAFFLVSAFSLHAVPGDEHWDAQFGAPGVTNITYAVAVNNGMVYAAGVATGGRTNAPLNLWDGKQWSVAAVFNGPSPMQVNDLAFVGNTLYAAGNFTNVNGVAANGLAKWDGTSWSGIGFSGVAYALAVDGNNLYVGGNYTNAGSVTVTNIGYWDGSAWHALGSGVGSYAGYSVRAVAVKNGLVYAGGFFTNCGSQFITNLAVWNGATWSAVGGGVNSLVDALAFNNNDLYVGGYSTLAGTTPVSGIAKWDGPNWSALGSGLTGGSAVAVSIASFNGMVCVAGAFTNAGGISATNFATWNGSSWSAAGNLSSTAYRAVASGGKLIRRRQLSPLAGGVWVNDIASWDGTRWSAFGTPGRHEWRSIHDESRWPATAPICMPAAISLMPARPMPVTSPALTEKTGSRGDRIKRPGYAMAVTNNRVYAGGYFTGTSRRHIVALHRMLGRHELEFPGQRRGPGLCLGRGHQWTLCGRAPTIRGTQYGSPFFNRWDGANWQNMINFTPGNTLFAIPLSDSIGYDAIAIQGTNVYLGGNIQGFTQVDPDCAASNGSARIARTSYVSTAMTTGGSWAPVSMVFPWLSRLWAPIFLPPALLPPPVVLPPIRLRNGTATNWSSVGGGVVGSGTVLALTTMGNNLYAGGTFTNMGGVAASRIAKWDGTNWSALGSGVSGISPEPGGDWVQDLYAGGSLRVAGDKLSYDMARWNGQVNFNIPQLTNPTWLTNNQFQVRLMGIGGLTNIIQATTNFTTWTPVLTNSAGLYDFTDPNSSSYPFRFYRALLGP